MESSLSHLSTSARNVLGGLEPGTTIIGILDNLGIPILDVLGIDIAVCALDTSILLLDVAYAARRRTRTALTLAARTGLLRLFAATSIVSEVPRNLNKHGRVLSVVPAEAIRLWEKEYVPCIHFLDPAGLPSLSGRVRELNRRDATDTPTGQIVELVKPDVILSCDQDLATFGLPDPLTSSQAGLPKTHIGREVYVTISIAYREQAVMESLRIGATFGGSVALAIGSVALQSVVRKIAKLDKRILLGVMIAAGIAFAQPDIRRWIAGRTRALRAALASATGSTSGYLNLLYQLVAEEQAASAEAGRIIASAKRHVDPPSTVYELAGMTLARTLRPLSATQMLDHAANLGYRLKLRGGKRSVGVALRQYPHLFEQQGRWRWGLRFS